jgi:hypothetical protein
MLPVLPLARRFGREFIWVVYDCDQNRDRFIQYTGVAT